MSYLTCPQCGEKIKVFEDEDLSEFLARMDLKLLAELPMCREIASLAGEKTWDQPLVVKIMQGAAAKIRSSVKD
jgi:hypothetical protein